MYSLFGVPVDMTVPVAPRPFAGNGEQHLAYEIYLRNHSGVEMLLTRLEVLDDGATLDGWEGADLHAIVAQRRPNVTDTRTIPPGGWAIVPIGGKPFIAQRYAIDWAKLGRDRTLFEGDRNENGSYFGYGAEVLAVADALVESVKDGIPENVPGSTTLRGVHEGDTLRAVAMTLDTIGGNYVILDLGDSRYAFYGHLMPGSLRVKPGDRVRRRQVI
ncbi:MAG: M23 family metallopeptidase, partial [Gemmatimonadales bacterium]